MCYVSVFSCGGFVVVWVIFPFVIVIVVVFGGFMFSRCVIRIICLKCLVSLFAVYSIASNARLGTSCS